MAKKEAGSPKRARAARSRRRRRKRGNWFLRLSIGKKVAVCLLGVLICLIASGVIYVSAKLNKLNTEEIPKKNIAVNDLDEGVGEGFTNFALFGSDSRAAGSDEGTRTDCIIVASLNNKTREVKMVSVYRDSLLDIGEGELQKCNGAYSFGGPKQAIDMLNTNLDLEIEDYVTVDFAAISDVIDLLGGVEIEVTEVEVPYLNKFLGETAQIAGKKANRVTKAGMQTLDGVQATTYARIRSTKGGDFKRAERQRYVIEKMVEKALRADLATINKIIDIVLPKIKTSLSATEILDYVKSFNKYKLGDNIGFPIEKTTDTLPGLGSIVIPVKLENNVVQLHEFLYGEEEYEPSSQVRSISRKIERKVGKRVADPETQWESPSDKKKNEGVAKPEEQMETQPKVQIN